MSDLPQATERTISAEDLIDFANQIGQPDLASAVRNLTAEYAAAMNAMNNATPQ